MSLSRIVLALMLTAAPAWSQTAPAELAAEIDAQIDRKLKKEKIPASPSADDGEFVRRVYLDLWGRIPTAAQAAASERDKRAALVDELLASPRYGEHFGRLWRERLASEDTVRGEVKAAMSAWLADGFNKGHGWNEMVADIVTAEGVAPGTAFVWNSLDDGQPRANKLAAAVARRFLGTQLQCAECHDHPYAPWKQADFWGLAVFFSRTTVVEVKDAKGAGRNHVIEKKEGPPKTRFGPPPLKMPRPGSINLPEDAGRAAGKTVVARVFQGARFEALDERVSFRPVLAAWLTSADNPYFARAAVNRLWAHFFGRGLVNPIDDLHDDNRATHPELLDRLAKEFIASGFDQRPLIRAIVASNAYQRSHRPVAGNQDDTEFYSRAVVRSLDAEMTVDSLLLALGYEQIPRRAKIGNKVYNFPDRKKLIDQFTTRDVDGDVAQYSGGIPQALLLLNGPLNHLVPATVERAVKASSDPAQIVETLFLSTLSRRPRDNERAEMVAYMKGRPDVISAATGVWWILVNSAEFVVVP